MLANGVFPLIFAQIWGDSRVRFPFVALTRNWKGVFRTGAVTPDNELMSSAALGDFPVNVFINPDGQES